MNRNKDAGFNQVPRLDITRSRFKRRQDVKLTLNAGQLIPFYVDDVTDIINSCAKKILLYNPKQIPASAVELGVVLNKCAKIS